MIAHPAGGGRNRLTATGDAPPLALYIHVPWCERKCPYCDFGSRPRPRVLPESAYREALLRDLALELDGLPARRPLTSIFIGGGTPSLLAGETVDGLLRGIRALADLAPDIEVTLEANPGTADAARFAAYRAAGVNRFSIGVQSFAARHLERLGRIHDPRQARAAVAAARAAGFANVNLDLMHGLPGQTASEMAADIEAAVALEPEHISYYQLTVEAGTPFGRDRPLLPDEDLIADGHRAAVEWLAGVGFAQYETSAFARVGRRCRHNLNYWEFGDYIGIGPGAHGKLTLARPGRVVRRVKCAGPSDYLAAVDRGGFTAVEHELGEDDLVLEFMLNALRLTEGFPTRLFEARTGLPVARITPGIDLAVRRGLLVSTDGWIRPSDLGGRFLDDLLQLFVR
ncbi:putative oxygen-independent coproporphyrinogen III oxidase [Thioflavicoccus mobilis 8321]|uniref:Heme chaperone HemW n=1 Tax=Thioflavicoccus mobilis 8321 TaxID=765912 RepID=L0GUG9_9GAMM|nr:radical SAM family heme chaperone HemW [Thioflavicoccus mobilis]AGA88954.1 putative oxygen-independent coproporphyrinogen III oxidase [Thioflavicoccus mobilis 8321]